MRTLSARTTLRWVPCGSRRRSGRDGEAPYVPDDADGNGGHGRAGAADPPVMEHSSPSTRAWSEAILTVPAHLGSPPTVAPPRLSRTAGDRTVRRIRRRARPSEPGAGPTLCAGRVGGGPIAQGPTLCAGRVGGGPSPKWRVDRTRRTGGRAGLPQIGRACPPVGKQHQHDDGSHSDRDGGDDECEVHARDERLASNRGKQVAELGRRALGDVQGSAQ